MPQLKQKLPEWATHEGKNRHGMPIVAVDTHAAYPALLQEYRDLYAERTPPEWRKPVEPQPSPGEEDTELEVGGELRKEWQDALDDLNQDDDEVSAYWLEVVYQTAKLDVILATGFSAELRMRDEGKRFRQAEREEGRGPARAAGGVNGGREAREHFKRLRGFFPG